MAGINDILGQILGGGQGGNLDIQKLVGPVMEMVQSKGGLQGLISQLQSSGLGDQVGSWIGTGENAKVDPTALANAVGMENVKELAAKTGLPVERVTGDLGQLLPNLIDKLSPGGAIPGVSQASELAKSIPGAEGVADQLTKMLGGLLGGSAGGGAGAAQ